MKVCIPVCFPFIQYDTFVPPINFVVPFVLTQLTSLHHKSIKKSIQIVFIVRFWSFGWRSHPFLRIASETPTGVVSFYSVIHPKTDCAPLLIDSAPLSSWNTSFSIFSLQQHSSEFVELLSQRWVTSKLLIFCQSYVDYWLLWKKELSHSLRSPTQNVSSACSTGAPPIRLRSHVILTRKNIPHDNWSLHWTFESIYFEFWLQIFASNCFILGRYQKRT
jgi:hypothetical protein